MKYCKHCGKELHEESNFCPHCMKTQIEKQTAITQPKKSKRLIYILIIGILIILMSLPVCKSMFKRNERSDNDTDSTIQSTESTSTTSTKHITTSVTSTTDTELITTATTQTDVTTTESVSSEIKTSISTHSQTTPTTTNTTHQSKTTTTTTVTTPQNDEFQLGNYITEGKTISQIMGYGGYENPGGIILTIEEITDTTLIFSIVRYSENGYASDTLSAKSITADIIGDTAEFQFFDMLDEKGSGQLTLEDGRIHIETWGVTENPTSIVISEYLTYHDY